MTYKLYYTDSKGTKRYLLSEWTRKPLELTLMEDALRRRWAEAAQGMILQIEESK